MEERMKICANCKHYLPRSFDDGLSYDKCKNKIIRVDPINGYVFYEACASLRYNNNRQVVDCGHYEEKKPWWKIFEKLKKLWKRKS